MTFTDPRVALEYIEAHEYVITTLDALRELAAHIPIIHQSAHRLLEAIMEDA